MPWTSGPAKILVLPLLLAAISCLDPLDVPDDEPLDLDCSIDSNLIFSGNVGKDGIPALTDPPFVAPDEIEYLEEEDRVIGLIYEGMPIAVPHNILWWHEIVNLSGEETNLSITYSPLTGSSVAFDRATVDGVEFGVSGLLFMNNLLMYDRSEEESLWPQMLGGARCGPSDGSQLTPFPVIEMTWGGWTELHPATVVVSGDLDTDRNYRFYPYGDYESSDTFLFDMPFIDERLPPKERILALPDGAGGGIAFRLVESEDAGWSVAELEHGSAPAVVFRDRERLAAAAFRPLVDGEPLTFEGSEEGIFDVETGSRWSVDGRAVEGEMEGASLVPVAEAYTAFWGAWVVHHPDALVWQER